MLQQSAIKINTFVLFYIKSVNLKIRLSEIFQLNNLSKKSFVLNI